METTVEIRSYPPEVGHHRHDYAQLILPCAGMMELQAERGSGRVGGSVAALVAAGEGHTFSAPATGRFVVLDLAGQDLPLAAQDRAFFPLDAGLRGLLDYFRAAQPISPALRAAWVALLLDRLPASPADRDAALLDRALAHMRHNLDRPLRVEDIARAAGASQSRLHRAMRARLDTTPHACLAALRLDLAERLLAEGQLPIAEIALRTGHADQSALTRALRRERGTTPARLRQLLTRA